MCEHVKADFKRVYDRSSYRGKLRKLLFSFGSQGFQAVWGFRMCHWLVSRRIPFIHLFIQRSVEILTGISISPLTKIGKGFLILHFGGIVINENVVIGENCTIHHGVTIGNKNPGGKSPQIGNNVHICVGAKVLGDITVGDNCVIGANAVLTKSIPSNSIAAGIPAKVIRENNS